MSNCACGCGEAAPEGKSFKRGHWSRTPEARVLYTERRIRVTPMNPSGLCECGCGQLTPLAKKDSTERGYRRGQHLRFVPGHHVASGSANHRWRGGRWIHKTGYVFVAAADHPTANRDGYVLEHRYVMEKHLGRILAKNEHVHHINGVKSDNDLNNLVVLTKAEHHQLHGGSGLKRWRAENPERATEHAKDAGRKGANARGYLGRTST
jgi:hypothetical protein